MPVGDDDLDQIEKQAAGKLPREYRQFAQRFGGSAPSGVATVTSAADGTRLPFSLFYGGGPKPGHNLLLTLRAYRGRMPASVVPVGRDDFGNQYCLDLDAREGGAVWLWNHEDEQDPRDYEEERLPVPADVMWSNMTRVADSFRDFLERLAVTKA